MVHQVVEFRPSEPSVDLKPSVRIEQQAHGRWVPITNTTTNIATIITNIITTSSFQPGRNHHNHHEYHNDYHDYNHHHCNIRPGTAQRSYLWRSPSPASPPSSSASSQAFFSPGASSLLFILSFFAGLVCQKFYHPPSLCES